MEEKELRYKEELVLSKLIIDSLGISEDSFVLNDFLPNTVFAEIELFTEPSEPIIKCLTEVNFLIRMS